MTTRPQAKRVRLVSIIVQPQFVLDDGETLTPVPVEPVQLTAADWAAYPERFERDRGTLERELNEGGRDAVSEG